jgi:hypothetical protein
VNCLALDLASHVGWAYFARPTAKPKCGTYRLPVTRWADNYGPKFHDLDQWLDCMVRAMGPQLLAFEAPLTPIDGKSWKVETNRDTIRQLTGYATIAELVAARYHVRSIEVAVTTGRAALCGTRFAKPDQRKAAAVRLGFPIGDEHQADACGVALAAFRHVGAT